MTLDGSGLKVGVIGSGFMAKVHTQAIRSAGAQLYAIASSDLVKSQAAASELEIKNALTVEALLSDPEIDVVHICTPNSTHAEFSIAALKAGKHVVCEKPVATNISEAKEIESAAKSASKIVSVPFVYRFHPLVREIRSQLSTQKISTFHGEYLQDWLLLDEQWNWRVDSQLGGGSRAFADIGSHLVDIIEFVTNQKMIDLVAKKSTVHQNRGGHEVNTEDAVAVIAELEYGAIGTLLVSQVAPGFKNGLKFVISTNESTYLFRQESPDEIWIGKYQGSELLPRDSTQLSEDAARLCILPGGHPQGYQDAFNAFIKDTYAAVKGDLRIGLPTITDGVRAVELTELVMVASSSKNDDSQGQS